MMARSRNIKPGLFKNEQLAECSIWSRYLFPGLWTIADREGKLEDRPKRIKAELLPFDAVEAEPLLRELAHQGFILRYRINGKNYIKIQKFSEHQTPHFKEKASTIPDPESPRLLTYTNDTKAQGFDHIESLQSLGLDSDNTIIKSPQNPSAAPPDSLIPDSLIPDSLIPDFPPTTVGEKPKAKKTFAPPVWIPPESWRGFEDMRQKIKKPMTDRAKSMIVKELEILKDKGHDPIAVLAQSEVNCWAGVYEIKNHGNGHGGNGSGLGKQSRLEAHNAAVAASLIARGPKGPQNEN